MVQGCLGAGRQEAGLDCRQQVREFPLHDREARLRLCQVWGLGPSLFSEQAGHLPREYGQPLLRVEIAFDGLQEPRFHQLA